MARCGQFDVRLDHLSKNLVFRAPKCYWTDASSALLLLAWACCLGWLWVGLDSQWDFSFLDMLPGLRLPTTRKGGLLTAERFRHHARLMVEGANPPRGLLKEGFEAYAL